MFNWIKTMFLLTALSGLFLGIGFLVGGRSGLIVALGLSLAMNFFSYWFSDKLVLASYKASELSEAEAPRLHSMLTELCNAADIPKPRLYRIPSSSPNAFATGRSPSHAAVAVTDGIVDLLDEEELKGVMAHELAHVKNRDILVGTVAASIASAIMFLASMSRWALMFSGGSRSRDGNPLALLVAAILAPFAAMIIQMAISRSREYGADRSGAAFAGTPMGLAGALGKLQRASARNPLRAGQSTSHLFIAKPFTGRGLFSLFSTHPPMEKRIARLMEMRG